MIITSAIVFFRLSRVKIIFAYLFVWIEGRVPSLREQNVCNVGDKLDNFGVF